jgi:hypothetical protein
MDSFTLILNIPNIARFGRILRKQKRERKRARKQFALNNRRNIYSKQLEKPRDYRKKK